MNDLKTLVKEKLNINTTLNELKLPMMNDKTIDLMVQNHMDMMFQEAKNEKNELTQEATGEEFNLTCEKENNSFDSMETTTTYDEDSIPS